MQQACEITVFSFYIPLFPSEEATERSSYDVNLNQVAVVCNLISQLATSKQTAANTSDRRRENQTTVSCDFPSQWTY